MSQEPRPDELKGTEQPFVAHLIELRDRLIRAVFAIGLCFIALAIYPGPAGMYDLLAAPLVSTLPKGATMIATSVLSPFLVPIKIPMLPAFMMLAFLIAHVYLTTAGHTPTAHFKAMITGWEEVD